MTGEPTFAAPAGTFIGWRPVFGILIAVSALVLVLSTRLKPDEGRPDVKIDLVGVALAASAIVLISFGFNNLNGWGLALARPNAPFNLVGVSPAPLMILAGIVLGQAFFFCQPAVADNSTLERVITLAKDGPGADSTWGGFTFQTNAFFNTATDLLVAISEQVS